MGEQMVEVERADFLNIRAIDAAQYPPSQAIGGDESWGVLGYTQTSCNSEYDLNN